MSIEQIHALQNAAELNLSDKPMPLAFSKAKLWQTPRYAVFGILTPSGASYCIARHKRGEYDLLNPVYVSDSLPDIEDTWTIYANG